MSCQDLGLKTNQGPKEMALLCYNKGCGQRFDPTENNADSCLFHPGYPIFHDALKGWSCCKKRTTDFSEFLAIPGCTKGTHSNEKPSEPMKPEICGNKGVSGCSNHTTDIIVQGPKSAEKMLKERPSAQEQMQPLVLKVSQSLEKELEKLRIKPQEEEVKKVETDLVGVGTSCKHAGCKEVYQGPESDAGTCIHHPGVPVFHEGMKFWSCCNIKTSDFNEFLDQRGCASGKHLWIKNTGRQAVSCRYDWHQTSNIVTITVYAKTAIPELSQVLANRTGLDIQISFQGQSEFRKQVELWGVIDVGASIVNLLPTKVEITLKKADPVTWGRLELSLHSQQITAEEEPQKNPEKPPEPEFSDEDDDLSWSEDEEPTD
ncbi:integrin subunit beta 1 binding protein 2 L homeolog isoform X1 [Xenopus laevis]|uniref:Integrin subunit beta 1 binding protein 2 L homeolog isoform X1 n=3 Tax=Xenopus laevis TaxID=8355 RepID=A0A1L8F740_XENLA|nr:integrin subunit beta 1 binding protein 2 L homeolog isoform X1 [Xenopus laevis]XP_018083958.1 integrin subunit beta 1 binding protein 2 L homeolog isoform X1 [Xenopus laevis]OCT67358.1 hypothetical protein XELAEV_18038653mg [Xenopus laevis]